MRKIIYIMIIINLFGVKLTAETGFIDTVYHFEVGKLSQYDSVSNYFPTNIFGEPSRNASLEIPESSPDNIQALGKGGEIIIGFKNYLIEDGPGVDFIIFENCFQNPINQGFFAEPALVSVSEDGIYFITFPFDSLTLEGLAGTNPTYGNENPFNYPKSGGNGFDLSTIGLKKAKFIKIRDLTEIIKTLPKEHQYYNPEFILTGFDLDAVAGVNLQKETNNIDGNNNISEIKIINKEIHISNQDNNKLEIILYDILGNQLQRLSTGHNQIYLKLYYYRSNIYILQIISNNNSKVYKINL